jgi:glycosyltransferase involved in cell wall biosynthesis
LTGCIESVLAQAGVEVRVLIIDDASPDETPQVAHALMERDTRLEYRRHDANAGLIATANAGLDWADDSDYVVLLSADDLLVPGALRRAVSAMEAFPNVGLVYGRAPYARAGRPLPSTDGRWRDTKVWEGRDWIRRRCRCAHNCISSPEVVVRTSVQRRAGRYDAGCFHTSDLNMWLRIAAVSDVAFIKGVPQAIYRVHGDSMLRSNRDPLLDLRERRAAFDSFFRFCRPRIDDAGQLQLQRMVGRALARQALWRASRAVDRGLSDGADALPVDDLIAFAFDVCPDASRLREWHGLRVRRLMGSGRSRWFIPFLVTGAAHRARGYAVGIRGRSSGV